MKPYLKWTAISLGSVVAIAHIGILGHLIRRQPERVVQVPTINIPRGTPYSSYKIEAGKDGYTIEYKANDPAILESEKSVDLIKNQDKKGFFGGTKTFEDRNEYRRDQYTMEGVRNMGGDVGELGKTGGASAECIAADAGARSQGAMAGTSIAAGVAVPAVSSIPYIGWLASGWALLLGQNLGSEAGSQVNSIISDC